MRTLISALVLLTLTACGGNGLVGSRFVKSANITASGGALTLTADDEPLLANASIVFPAGALTQDTTITVELGLGDLTAGKAGPVLIVGPADAQLLKDVQISLPIQLAAGQRISDVFIAAKADDSSSRFGGGAIAFDDSKGVVKFSASKLRAFQAAAAAVQADGGVVACVTDDVCSANQDCVNGACTWKSGTGGACVTDDTCAWDQDCVSGACVSKSLAHDGGYDDHGSHDGGYDDHGGGGGGGSDDN